MDIDKTLSWITNPGRGAPDAPRTEGQLKCPHIESSRYLCDRDAQYSIHGIVLCAVHARRRMEQEGR